MDAIERFLTWFGVIDGGHAPWFLLLILILVLVVLVTVGIAIWIWVNRLLRNAWATKSMAAQARARAVSDQLTADRMAMEATRAKMQAEADIARIAGERDEAVLGARAKAIELEQVVAQQAAKIAVLEDASRREVEARSQVETSLKSWTMTAEELREENAHLKAALENIQASQAHIASAFGRLCDAVVARLAESDQAAARAILSALQQSAHKG
jgi:cytoskeletal protein RodZ